MSSMTRLGAGALALGLVAGAAYAQGGPPGGGNSPFAKFREQHKMTFQLQTSATRGLAECERAKDTSLKPAQAKQLLGIFTPLKSKPKLTQEDAKAALQKFQKAMDPKQLAVVDRTIQDSQRRGMGGGGPPGGGPPGGGAPGGGAPGGGPPGARPGGPGGPGGAGGFPAFDPAKAKNFNPFNPVQGSFGYERNIGRNKALFTFLTARAANKPAKLDLPRGFGGGGGRPGGPGSAGAPGAR